MANYGTGSTILLPFEDSSITAQVRFSQPSRRTGSGKCSSDAQSIHIALHHLYASASHLIDVQNARAVLATAYLFGLHDLATTAYTIISESISHDHILELVSWLSPSPSAPSPSASPITPTPNQNGLNPGSSAPSSTPKYGEWSERLGRDIENYLITTLPSSSLEPSASIATDPMIISVYAALPYALFKKCVESDKLPIQPTQARFGFAKRVIAQRRKVGTNAGMEETAVLAIQGQMGAVQVARKHKKGRTALWKVEQ